MRTKYLLLPFILFFVLLTSDGVFAQELEITGNGSASTSTVVVKSGSIVNVVQTNSAEIKNSIQNTSNTGGNQIGGSNGGSIKTGDSSTVVKINNFINQNSTTIPCCDSPTPAPSVKPMATPTSVSTESQSNSSNNTSSSNPSGSGSNIGGAPVVLGLSNTSSASDHIKILTTTIGIVCIISSLGLISSARHA